MNTLNINIDKQDTIIFPNAIINITLSGEIYVPDNHICLLYSIFGFNLIC